MTPTFTHELGTDLTVRFKTLRGVLVFVEKSWVLPCSTVGAELKSIFLDRSSKLINTVSRLRNLEFKVLDTVVRTIAVLVMDNLSRLKRSAKVFFHNQSMDIKQLAVNSFNKVTSFIKTTNHGVSYNTQQEESQCRVESIIA